MKFLKLAAVFLMVSCLYACTKTSTRALNDHVYGGWTIDSSAEEIYRNGSPDAASASYIYPYTLTFDHFGYAYFSQLRHYDSTTFTMLDAKTVIMDLDHDYRLDTAHIEEYAYQRHIEIWGYVDAYYYRGALYETLVRYSLTKY